MTINTEMGPPTCYDLLYEWSPPGVSSRVFSWRHSVGLCLVTVSPDSISVTFGFKEMESEKTVAKHTPTEWRYDNILDGKSQVSSTGCRVTRVM